MGRYRQDIAKYKRIKVERCSLEERCNEGTGRMEADCKQDIGQDIGSI